MSEDAGRPDPLKVALRAIGDYERSMLEAMDSEVTLQAVYQKAQLRVLFALAMEVRAARLAMGVQDGTAD